MCRRIKTNGRFKGIPVVLATSFTDPGEVMRALETGADSFIRMPYERPQLIPIIRDAMANDELREEKDLGGGIAMHFADHTCQVTSDRFQALKLLLSTYEAAVRQNADLVRTRDELRGLTETLKQRVSEKTMSLNSEIERPVATEHAISEERRLLRTVLDTIPDPVYLKDTSLRFVACNSAFVRRLHGNSSDEIIGKNDYDLFAHDRAGDYCSIDPQVLSTGSAYALDDDQSTDDRQFSVRSLRVPVRDELGAVSGVLIIDRDATLQKSGEREVGTERNHLRTLGRQRHLHPRSSKRDSGQGLCCSTRYRQTRTICGNLRERYRGGDGR